MSQEYSKLIAPAIIGGTVAFTLASILQQHYKAQTQANDEDTKTRPFGTKAECRTLPGGAFEIYEDLGPEKDPRSLKAILLSPEAVEKVIKQNVQSVKVDRPGNRVLGWDTNYVVCNAVNEDRMNVDLIASADLGELIKPDAEEGFWQTWARVRKALWESREGEEGKGEVIKGGEGGEDLVLMSMIDGHGGGPECAQVLQRTLNACLANGLAKQGKGDIGKTMRETIVALNRDIIRMPLTLLQQRDHLLDPALSPLLPHPAPALLSVAPLTLRGACISSAIIDNATDKMYIAHLGDCRVVGGWYNPETKTWRCDVMSEIGDADAKNPLEVDKVRALHPHDADLAICDTGFGQRVLGLCAITRAMGNAESHLPSETTDKIEASLGIEYYPRQVPKNYPPYVLDEPEIITRDLKPASGEQLKFIILAVDGLWDRISSEEACLLAAAHHENHSPGTILKTDLVNSYPFDHPTERPYPADPLPGTTETNSQGVWQFHEADDAASHLLRNAFGRGDTWEGQRLLSLKAPDARFYRDDTTVIVVKLGE